MENNTDLTLLNSKKIPTVVLLILCGFVILVGFWGTYQAGNFVDDYERKVLLSRAENAAVLIDPTLVQKLSGSADDINLDEYKNLKDKMILLKKTNPDAKFVYLLGLHENNQLFFFVDSEQIGVDGYSGPGDSYSTPAPGEIQNFMDGKRYTNGPYGDAWGHWVSGYSPIIDPNTGTTIAMLGMDIDSSIFEKSIIYTRVTIGIITTLFSLFLLGLIFIIHRSRKNNDQITSLQNDMVNSYNQLLEIQEMVKIGRIILWTDTYKIGWNDVVFQIFEIPIGTKPSYEIFENKLTPEDRKNFTQTLEMLSFKKDNTINLIMHIKNSENIKRVRLVGTFYKSQDNKTNRIVATIQDITNLE